MFFLVYKTVHVPSGKFYIGRHATKTLEDGYMGSGRLIVEMLKKFPREEFTREVIWLCDTAEEMLSKELSEISPVFETENCLNLVLCDPSTARGSSPYGRVVSQQTREKMKIVNKLNASKRPQEMYDRIGLKHRGKTISAEMRTKQSAALTGDKNPRAKTWVLERDTGEVFKVTALKKWCRDHGIKYNSLYMTMHRQNFYNGLRIKV